MDPNTNNDNPENGAGTISDEQMAALTAKILETLQPSLTSEINKTITGAVGRVKKSLDDRIADVESRVTAKPDPADDASATPTPAAKPSGDGADQLKALQDQIAAQERRMAEMQKAANDRFEQLQSEAAQEKAAAQQMVAKTNLAAKLSDRVANPNHLLALAEQSGAIQYKDGQYVYTQKDAFNEDEFVPVDKAGKNGDYFDSLLAGDFAYMAKARPGTGLGSSNGKTTTAATQPSKYFGDSPADAATLAQVAMGDGGIDSIVDDLLASSGG
jgi:uncharacterized phage infection (PIP) family protein YhgE